MSVLIETSKGNIVIDLFYEKCPKACKNFLKLCKLKYYNDCLFFNIQRDFIIQTGDPTNTGKGGESIYGMLYGQQARFFEDELHKDLKHDRIGTVSYAHAANAPDTNASQFFIQVSASPLHSMDEKNTVFGIVAEGLDVLQKINNAFTDEQGFPYQIIRIKHTDILDDPFPDPPGLQIPDRSPRLTPGVPSAAGGKFKRCLLGEEEDIDDAKVYSEDEILEIIRRKEAKARAIALEVLGDLPDADVKPPETVLFVCKLNPVTQDDDLEIIFSRFGKINSCQIIRDQKTRESLGYAFIDFAEKKSCENAYFKMENALIDDRRIHVDFSQSVSKIWNKFRRGEVVVDRSQWEVDTNKNKKGGSSSRYEQPQQQPRPKSVRGHEYVFNDDEEDKKRKRSPPASSRNRGRRSPSPPPFRKDRRRSPSPRRRSPSPQQRFSKQQRSRSPSPRRRRRSPSPPPYRKDRRRSPSPRRRSPSPQQRFSKQQRSRSPSPQRRR